MEHLEIIVKFLSFDFEFNFALKTHLPQKSTISIASNVG